MKILLSLIFSFSMVCMSCNTIPHGADAVGNFKLDKYLGTWYEIARFDYVFEKNLSHVTAFYTIKADGTVRVDNRGYNNKTGKWQESVGKAKFKKDESKGELLVSFFGPFYSGYNVIKIDPEYKYALVAGKNLKYLWLLSRDRTMPENVKNTYLHEAEAIGYDISKLIWVEQERKP